jgi:hypothetical protein
MPVRTGADKEDVCPGDELTGAHQPDVGLDGDLADGASMRPALITGQGRGPTEPPVTACPV